MKKEKDDFKDFLACLLLMLIAFAIFGVVIGTVSALQEISPEHPFMSFHTLSTFLLNAFCGFLFFVSLSTMIIGIGLMMITRPGNFPGIAPLLMLIGFGLLVLMFSLAK